MGCHDECEHSLSGGSCVRCDRDRELRPDGEEVPDPGPMEGECPRCSYAGCHIFHGSRCDKDPAIPANVIAKYFKERSGDYIGIVWDAIANNAVRALEENGYKIVEPDKSRAH